MAIDISEAKPDAPTEAPTSDEQTPPPPPVLRDGPPPQTSRELMREAYRVGRVVRATSAQGRQPVAEAPTPPALDKPPPAEVQSKQTSTPPEAAPAEPTAPAPPPPAPPSAEEQPAPVAEQVVAAPVPAAPPSAEPAPAVVSQPREAQLPADYDSASWRARFQSDPLLRRTIARIEGDPKLSPAQKAERIAGRVLVSEQRSRETVTAAQADRRLLDEDPLAYRDRIVAQEAAQQQSRQQVLAVSRLIATALDVDPEDRRYLEAGPRDGEPYEVGLQRFTEFVLEQSPLVQARLAAGLGQLQVDHGTALDKLRAEHAQALVQAAKLAKEEQEAAVERAVAKERGSQTAPPRASGGLPAEAERGGGPPAERSAAILHTRGLLAAGYRLRKEAQ